MAALSRSPSCSSSPAVLSLGTVANATTHRRSLIPLPTVPGSASVNPNNTSILNANPLATLMTPSIDFSQCKTPLNNHNQQTPLNNNNIINNIGINRCPYTPHIGNNDLVDDNNSDNEPISEYVLEYLWHEQSRYS